MVSLITKILELNICSQLTMADYQYGLSNILDNALHEVIAKRRKSCESIADESSSEYFLQTGIILYTRN